MMPASWVYKDGEFYEKVFGELIKLRYNHPVSVTWYEANAFCKFYGYRMLKEKEWEYMAISNKNSNCDYNYPQSVLKEKNEKYGSIMDYMVIIGNGVKILFIHMMDL